MNKKSLIWILGIIAAIAIVFMIYRFANRQEDNLSNQEQNLINISYEEDEVQGEVTDGCLYEWEDYNKYLGEKVEEASNNLSSQDTHYIIKNVEGYIQVFYINENNEEVLYRKTDISTDYLSEEDVEDLKIGIEVVGTEALNKMLEDFE